jgi:hypothetical protein
MVLKIGQLKKEDRELDEGLARYAFGLVLIALAIVALITFIGVQIINNWLMIASLLGS